MNISTKQRLLLAIAPMIMLFMFAVPAVVDAAVPDPQTTNYGLDDFGGVGLGQKDDVKTIAANIINIVLGFLGIVAVVIIIFSGFKWMTAAGNEEQVTEARKMLLQAIAGLAIVFLAWGIASFVLTQLKDATTGI
jgi:type IV secretory pathway VirB2 component (pilin)